MSECRHQPVLAVGNVAWAEIPRICAAPPPLALGSTKPVAAHTAATRQKQ